jgi:hypothetical protein
MIVKIAHELWEFGVLVAAAGPSLKLTISAEAQLISFRKNIADLHRQMDQWRKLPLAQPMMASARPMSASFTTNDISSRQGCRWHHRSGCAGSPCYRGSNPVSTQKFTSFVELQIGEGPIPEAEGKTGGVVDSSQAYCGTTAKSPGLRAMQARHRCCCVAARWPLNRRSCWQWSVNEYTPKAVVVCRQCLERSVMLDYRL